MPVFEYKGFSEAGKAIDGVREADSPKGLRGVLRKEGVFLSEIKLEAEKGARPSPGALRPSPTSSGSSPSGSRPTTSRS